MTKLRIALDCSGGDYGCTEAIAAARIAVAELPNVSITLYGPAELADQDACAGFTYITTNEISGLDRAIESLNGDYVDAVVSSAHTASHIAACKARLQCSGSRAILAAFIPNVDSTTSVLLDAGATLHADAEQLTEFGIMGAELARRVLGIANPTVGLLNIGTETCKGTQSIREAARNLRSLSPHLGFSLAGTHGFVEANALLQHPADVIVSDGWSGNLVIKTAEGAFKGLTAALKQEAQSSWIKQLTGWLASRFLRSTLSRFKPENHNGGLWLGVKKGVVVKSHGNSKAAGIVAAIRLAIKAIKAKCTTSVNRALTKAQLLARRAC